MKLLSAVAVVLLSVSALSGCAGSRVWHHPVVENDPGSRISRQPVKLRRIATPKDPVISTRSADRPVKTAMAKAPAAVAPAATTGAGFRELEAAEGCCGTGCATACEVSPALQMVAGGNAAGGEGYRVLEGAEGCCGTGCAVACEVRMSADAGDDAPSADVHRALEGVTGCCGTGCATACQ